MGSSASCPGSYDTMTLRETESASEGTSTVSHFPFSWVKVTVGLSGIATDQVAKYMYLAGSAPNALTRSRVVGLVIGIPTYFNGNARARVFQQWWTAVWAGELERMCIQRFERPDDHCIVIAGLPVRSFVAGAKVLAIESGEQCTELILVEVE